MVCIDLGYEVVTDTVNLHTTPPATKEFRVTAPAGKKPLSGSVKFPPPTETYNRLIASYPDGQDWVFEFVLPGSIAFDVDLYVVCIKV